MKRIRPLVTGLVREGDQADEAIHSAIAAWLRCPAAQVWGLAAVLGVPALRAEIDAAVQEIVSDPDAQRRWYPKAWHRVLKRRGKGLEAKELHPGKPREYLTHQEYRPRPYLDLPDETLSREVSVIAAQCAEPEHEIWGAVLNGGLNLLDERLQNEFSEYAERRRNPRRPSLRELYGLFGLSDPDTCPSGQSTHAPMKGSVK